MQELIARVEKIKFDIERDVEQQRGVLPLPFSGMDKSGAAVCYFFIDGLCKMGSMCPFQHISGEKTVVCKHWLRGLCKKGDQCEFLHEYDMSKMPECYFYSKFGDCNNRECPFLHIDPASNIRDCPWYERGFCKLGSPHCKSRHTRRVMCLNYLVGFCPEGPKCKFMHPKAELYVSNHNLSKETPQLSGLSTVNTVQYKMKNMQEPAASSHSRLRDLKQVTCFKCGDKGHFAKRCGKSQLAFLMGK
uniref:Cleavage and polyadenylation specificity factor subunit 4 n=1 Tax=Latimeria chalumnae TaxID=7897 RepID=H3BGK0_LATCH